MTGDGLTYQDRQRVRVKCLDFGEEMVVGSLAVHLQTQHGGEEVGRWQCDTPTPDRETQTYRMDSPIAGGL